VTWLTTELREAVHVHPFYESGHILGPWCWCDPRRDGERSSDLDECEKAVLVHRDQLQRTVQE